MARNRVQIEKEKERLYENTKDDIIKAMQNLVDNKIKEYDKYGKKITKTKIADDLNITYQALSNYTFDRIPDLKQLLYIKEYFSVPFSTFFKEKKENNNKNSITDISIALGLDSETINILSELKRNTEYDSFENNNENKIILFLINAIIKDKELFKSLSSYFAIALGRNILDKKNDKFIAYKPFGNDKSAYSMTKFSVMTDFINLIDDLVAGENVPKDIREKAEKYAFKYSGEMQQIIKENNSKKIIDNYYK